MADEKPVVKVTDPTYGNVSADHPTIVTACKNLAKQGVSKEQAMKIVGMPMEVIDRHYRAAEKG